MAAKKATPAKKAAKRPSRPMPEYNAEEMRKRSSRTMTQKELEQELVKRYGYPMVSPMTAQEAIKKFQKTVAKSKLGNYPGVMKAAAKVADIGHNISAEEYMKKQQQQRLKNKQDAQKRMAVTNAFIERDLKKDREQRMAKARQKAARLKTK